MNFAVIEYASKTGTVWRHTPQKPNYLCDPQTEMDPTSFGCYVSALEGEHIPITALVKPTLLKRLYRKIIGRWPPYNISYLKQFDALLIVHQISDGHEVTALTKRIRTELPHIKILGVPTQPFGILKKYWQHHPDWLDDFKAFMDTCHVFITIVRSTLPEWQQMTLNRVEYVPQPYPIAHASKYWQGYKQKEKVIFVAGRTSRDNIGKGLAAAAMLQEQFPDYTIHITNIDEPGETFDISALGDARYEAQPFQSWQEHLKYLATVALVVNTDYTQTRGRVQVDCAAVGTPCIGADSDAQVDLFPDLPASPDQTTDSLVAQGKRILEDTQFYGKIAETARSRLTQYSYEKSANRIRQLMQSI